MKGVLIRASGLVALLALLGMEVISVSAAPSAAASTIVFDVANPPAGATVPRGRLNISGVAYDTAATSGTGIDQITVFLGDRDMGGASSGRPGGYLGAATLGLPNPMAGSGQLSKAGFNLKTFSLRKGAWTLWIYARSSASNKEAVVQIPVKVDVK
jgi:hypothetical protein